jgi:hypothetical protein
MVKKSTKEMKKYLQRCKGWLSDKKAFCEMNNMTLDATKHSIKHLYEETLFRQDALIARLIDSEEFKDLDVAVAASEVKLHVDGAPGSARTLIALRGLPFRDSIRIKKKDRHQQAVTSVPHPVDDPTGAPRQLVANFPIDSPEQVLAKVPVKREPVRQAAPQRRELFVDMADNVSVNSNLSDPDEEGEQVFSEEQEAAKTGDASESENSDNNFGKDAPWRASLSASSSLAETAKEDSKPLSLLATPESPTILEEADHAVNASSSQEAPVGEASTEEHDNKRPNASIDTTTAEESEETVDQSEAISESPSEPPESAAEPSLLATPESPTILA